MSARTMRYGLALSTLLASTALTSAYAQQNQVQQDPAQQSRARQVLLPQGQPQQSQAPQDQTQPPPILQSQIPSRDPSMKEIVVTATGRPEEVSKFAGTIQVINQDRIAHSAAKSVTDLPAENAIGFMSEWSAAQTSINIRGASTEGQGRDFKSQVLILINGHRAGTANVSKLSVADVERIEVVRGPSS